MYFVYYIGTVSLDEYLEWHFISEEEEHGEMKELAKKIFETIDEHHTGEVTLEEFINAVQKLDATMSVDEITGIVRDLDEDGNGTISLEEFTEFISKAYE